MCSCVETTLGSIVDAKPKFDRFLLNPIIFTQPQAREERDEQLQRSRDRKAPRGIQGRGRDAERADRNGVQHAIAAYG
ncbi:hypothetical protein CSHISOI_06308 [Colletotrichum shisoi]|uniref:Uncharacterized protein n=1 Tax=Colletotrichum shisoi TaxID=2078593 RepID=A0A5Q4BS08_9PEZI|nr:hypothetical protein CSHISOI_06308 [Colletotrichum shisoi]